MERDINPPSVCPKSSYLGRCLEGIKSESNTTIDRDSSSTTSGNLNSVLHLFESTVISVCKKESVLYDKTLID